MSAERNFCPDGMNVLSASTQVGPLPQRSQKRFLAQALNYWHPQFLGDSSVAALVLIPSRCVNKVVERNVLLFRKAKKGKSPHGTRILTLVYT